MGCVLETGSVKVGEMMELAGPWLVLVLWVYDWSFVRICLSIRNHGLPITDSITFRWP